MKRFSETKITGKREKAKISKQAVGFLGS
jgi:hypothetical protein